MQPGEKRLNIVNRQSIESAYIGPQICKCGALFTPVSVYDGRCQDCTNREYTNDRDKSD